MAPARQVFKRAMAFIQVYHRPGHRYSICRVLEASSELSLISFVYPRCRFVIILLLSSSYLVLISFLICFPLLISFRQRYLALFLRSYLLHARSYLTACLVLIVILYGRSCYIFLIRYGKEGRGSRRTPGVERARLTL